MSKYGDILAGSARQFSKSSAHQQAKGHERGAGLAKTRASVGGSVMISVLTRARVRQIHFCSQWLRRLSAVAPIFALMRRLRDKPPMRVLLAALTGYNRPFPNLRDAAAAIAGYEGGGHSNPDYHTVKFTHATALRPGDYAALFHMERILPQLRSVFDLGGSVGELFYCYTKYLEFPRDLIWTVCDLPETVSRGEELARGQKEDRLRFTSEFEDAAGTDLLMVSGALHYFEQSIAQLISRLDRKPRYVLLNRAPLVDGPAFATVEDGESYRLACMLHNRREVIDGMVSLGYELADEWRIHGRWKVVPCYPDHAAQYSGLFFRARELALARHRTDRLETKTGGTDVYPSIVASAPNSSLDTGTICSGDAV